MAQDAPLRARLFSLWGVALWLVLLQAASGAFQYARHGMYLEVIVPAAVVVVSAGCILRQEWARRVMTVLAPLLALWTAVMLVRMWMLRGKFDEAMANARAIADGAMQTIAVEQITQEQSAFYIGMAIKFITIPVLAWLAWKLMRPDVKAQFGRRK
ncbi:MULTISPECIES: hypothetical protein [Dyella]|uniref:Uncharacterized protein n=2 Tax=Dyella TaxID=231454 RepID=A0A4R0YQ03_9GAMM|nr:MULTISPECIES: hypothetical protein [Dyella]TBR36794.1 hypothetical protein EYV96_12850 [Dyella terrae]TCI08115.1 hypothetical protein EZM97_26020 [Dyella soli]